MPTGYTHAVSSGKIKTLSEFALTCARGMGALISMRDDPADAPIPDEIKPETAYHDANIAAAKEILETVPKLSAEECETRAKAEFDAAMEGHLQYEKGKIESRHNYQAMIDKVQGWTPKEEINTLKEFMLEQLNSSLEFDCGGKYKAQPPVRLTGECWREKVLAKASNDIAYHTSEREKEIARAADRTKWLEALRESLTR